jgi:hypothetical protein
MEKLLKAYTIIESKNNNENQGYFKEILIFGLHDLFWFIRNIAVKRID